MLYVLYALFFTSCIVLVAAVLLQPGKTDAGALFTSNVSSAAFGPRGTASVLSKLTIAAAAIFMLTALMISMPALQGGVSVLQSATDTPADTPAEQPANTNTQIITVPVSNSNANAAPGEANSNGALIETPATNAFEANVSNANRNAPPNR